MAEQEVDIKTTRRSAHEILEQVIKNGREELDRDALINLGLAAIGNSIGFVFWSGVIGGWLIALVAWMVSASHWTISQIVIVWLLTFLVGIGHFAHCVATSGEILAAVVGVGSRDGLSTLAGVRCYGQYRRRGHHREHAELWTGKGRRAGVTTRTADSLPGPIALRVWQEQFQTALPPESKPQSQ